MASNDKSSTTITIKESNPQSSTDKAAAAGGPAAPAPPPGFAAKIMRGSWKKGLAIFDFLIRLLAIAASLSAAVAMGTTDETLPFFTQLFQFRANYDDFPAFTFFVVGNAVTSGYLVFSLPFSIVGMIRPHAVGPKLLLFIFDTVMVALSSASSASAAAIVYLAHSGNQSANWVAICNRFTDFCQQVSGAVIASFVAMLLLMLLVIFAGLTLRKH